MSTRMTVAGRALLLSGLASLNAPTEVTGAPGPAAVSFADARRDFIIGLNPLSAATADFNEDGNQDVVVTKFEPMGLSVLMGGGDGTFADSQTIEPIYAPNSVAIADFNGDGHSDIAVGAERIVIILGNGDGSFQPPRTTSRRVDCPWSSAT